MKTKKRNIRSVQKPLGKENDPTVIDYCEACVNIRKGTFDFSEKSKEKFFRHTCKKSGREIDELIFHSSIINGMLKFGQIDL